MKYIARGFFITVCMLMPTMVSAQGIPVPGHSYIEDLLARSPLGKGIYEVQKFYYKSSVGPYSFTGYIPCSLGDDDCGTSGSAFVKFVSINNLSLAACILYTDASLLTYLAPPPHGPNPGCGPVPIFSGTSYTFDGYQACSGGFLCFNGWMPLIQGPMSGSQCLAMQYASGYKDPPGISGPQPPLGTCIPPVPH